METDIRRDAKPSDVRATQGSRQSWRGYHTIHRGKSSYVLILGLMETTAETTRGPCGSYVLSSVVDLLLLQARAPRWPYTASLPHTIILPYLSPSLNAITSLRSVTARASPLRNFGGGRCPVFVFFLFRELSTVGSQDSSLRCCSRFEYAEVTLPEPLPPLRGQRPPLLPLLALGAALFMATRRFIWMKILLLLLCFRTPRVTEKPFCREESWGLLATRMTSPCGTREGGL